MAVRPFADMHNFTMFHNSILEVVMPSLSPNSWKVLCFFLRKTTGYQKKSDQIAYSQIKEGTGIGSYTTIKLAIDELLKKDYIIATQADIKTEATTYTLNLDLELDWSPSPTKTVEHRTTETVMRGVTETVVRPTTETVDTIKRDINSNIKREAKHTLSNSKEVKPSDTSDQVKAIELFESIAPEGYRTTPHYYEVRDLSKSYGFAWFSKFYTECVGKKKGYAPWSYMHATFRNWKAEGRDAEGNPPPKAQPIDFKQAQQQRTSVQEMLASMPEEYRFKREPRVQAF